MSEWGHEVKRTAMNKSHSNIKSDVGHSIWNFSSSENGGGPGGGPLGGDTDPESKEIVVAPLDSLRWLSRPRIRAAETLILAARWRSNGFASGVGGARMVRIIGFEPENISALSRLPLFSNIPLFSNSAHGGS